MRQRGIAALQRRGDPRRAAAPGHEPAPRQRRSRHDRQGGAAKAGPRPRSSDSGIGKGAIAPTETLVPERRRGQGRRAQAGSSGVHGAVAPEGADWRRDGTRSWWRPQRGRRLGGRPRHGRGLIDAAHAPPRRARGRHRAAERGLHRRGLRLVPADDRADRDPDVPAAARAFRSLLLPLKAVVLNVLSVGAAWGIMALIWQEGHGSEEIWGSRRPARSHRGSR